MYECNKLATNLTFTTGRNHIAASPIPSKEVHVTFHAHIMLYLQFTPTPLLTSHTSISIYLRHRCALLVRIRQQRTLVELLHARRHVDGWVPREEVDGFEAHFQHFAGHHGEVFDAWDLVGEDVSLMERRQRRVSRFARCTYMVDAELHEDNHVCVDDGVFPVCPGAHAGTAAGLVRVFSAAVELVVAVAYGVDVVVGEFSALVVEAVLIGKDLLERRRVDLVSYWFAVDRVSHSGVLDLEGPVGVRVEVVAA